MVLCCSIYVVVSSVYSVMQNFVLFVFKQKTAYEMRISDWSSDVCSSDLRAGRKARARHRAFKSDDPGPLHPPARGDARIGAAGKGRGRRNPAERKSVV